MASHICLKSLLQIIALCLYNLITGAVLQYCIHMDNVLRFPGYTWHRDISMQRVISRGYIQTIISHYSSQEFRP